MMPVNQLIMQKHVCNHLLMGGSLQTAQVLSVYFDGNSRHTAEVGPPVRCCHRHRRPPC